MRPLTSVVEDTAEDTEMGGMEKVVGTTADAVIIVTAFSAVETECNMLQLGEEPRDYRHSGQSPGRQ